MSPMFKMVLKEVFLSEELTNIVWQDNIRWNAYCAAMMTATLEMLCNINLERPLHGFRQPAEVLLAFGGFYNNLQANVIQVYNVRRDCWRAVCDKSIFLPELSQCVYTDGFIYCIGGVINDISISSMTRFSIAEQTWEKVGSMHEARAQPTAVALNGFVYALGGWTEEQTLSSAERFQPSTNQWNVISPMKHERADAGATTLNGRVYIFGGLVLDQALSSAECYNPETNQWTLIPHMGVAYKDQIFVMGGCSNGMCLSIVEVYNPASMTWRIGAPMNNCCYGFGVALLENQLYVVESFDSEDIQLSAVRRYDVEKDRWNVVNDLAVPHGAVSCCVVERIPYAAAFRL